MWNIAKLHRGKERIQVFFLPFCCISASLLTMVITKDTILKDCSLLFASPTENYLLCSIEFIQDIISRKSKLRINLSRLNNPIPLSFSNPSTSAHVCEASPLVLDFGCSPSREALSFESLFFLLEILLKEK